MFFLDSDVQYRASLDMPIALVKGCYNLPQKWKNFSVLDKKDIDGVMIGDFRNGVVKIYFFLEFNL